MGGSNAETDDRLRPEEEERCNGIVEPEKQTEVAGWQ